jgi:hypothetical protein
LLGYVAGEMLVSEALFKSLLEAQHALHWLVPAACAVLVLMLGKWLALRMTATVKAEDLVDEQVPAAHDKS